MPAIIRSRSLRLVICALGLTLVHIGFVQHFEPFEWLFSKTPITGIDFDTHAEQTWRVIEGLTTQGKSWVYDVQLQAGFPNGTIFDADNKLWELWTYALHGLHVPKASAFNSFVFLAHLLILPWIFIASRLFGLTSSRAVIATSLASLIWWFDSYAHWFWWIGTVAYIFAAYFFILPLALFYRYTQERTLPKLALTTLLVALAHLLHPYSFFILAPPMALIYVRAARGATGRYHAGVLAMCALVIAANAYWLRAALQHWHYILDSAFYGQSHGGFLFADFFNLLIDASTTGYIGTRSAFRWLALIAALGTLWLWRDNRDQRYAIFAFTLLTMYVFAYLAPVLVPPIRQIQPYRFVASAAFLSVIPAGEMLGLAWERRADLTNTLTAKVVLIAAAALSVQHLSSQVLYYLPRSLPGVPKVREAPFPLSATGFAPNFEYRHAAPQLVDMTLDRWIDDHADEGRIAVPDWTGERFAWSTRAQILGGFVDLNLSHARAHPLRWADRRRPNAQELAEYIDTYAVRYFVVRFEDFGLPGHPDLVTPLLTLSGATIYRTNSPASYFSKGAGELRAMTNRIEITNTDPAADLVIKYHWHEALACTPACRIERADNQRDEVGFIRIPAPHPSKLSIYNSYRM